MAKEKEKHPKFSVGQEIATESGIGKILEINGDKYKVALGIVKTFSEHEIKAV